MAVITLKDLMDPLAKIAAATENNTKKLDDVISAVIGGAGASLNQELFKELQIQTTLLRTIAGNTGNSIMGGSDGGNTDKLKQGAEAIKLLGGGAASLSFGLLTFMLIPKSAITKFTETIRQLMDTFNEIDENKVKEGAESFQLIANSIGRFARGLALASILLIPGIIGAKLLMLGLNMILPTFERLGDAEQNVERGAEILDLMGRSLLQFTKGLVLAAIGAAIGVLFTPVIVLSMLLIGGAFAILGSADKLIRPGAKSLRVMGRSLISFSIGLVTFALASMFVLSNPIILLAMVGTLILLGGAFAILGIVSAPIRKGASALFLMGISLIAFSIGYFIFSLVTKNVTLEQIGIQSSILLGLGLAIGLIGMGLASVVKGTIAIALMGIGLLIFGLGYLPFAAIVKGTTAEDVAQQAGLLLALGLEFAAAGLAAILIMPGAAAYAAVGIGLALLSIGLKAIKKVDFTEKDSIKLVTMLSGVKSAFLGGDNAEKGFFSKLGGAITGTVDSVAMIAAAGSFAAAGVALKLLAYGLTAFKKIGWNNTLSLELTTALTGITTAFAAAGGSEQVPSSSFFGQIFSFKRTAVEEGIMSVMSAGRALSKIAEGLKSFKSLVDSNIKFGSPDSAGNYEKDTLGYAVVNTVGFINQAFAAVADTGNVQAGGFFNTLFNIKKNKVAEGISAVSGAGKELTNIVNGLAGFQTLIDKKINWTNLGNAISMSLGFVGSAFATIGGKESTDSAFFGMLQWNENEVKKGVNAVSGAGKELINIAEALSKFQSMIVDKVDFNIIGQGIKTSLTLVGDAFAIIGGKEVKDDAWGGMLKWDESTVSKGIANVKGAGTELLNIAEGLQAFADLKDPKAVATSIKEIFTSVGNTFTYYYKDPKFKNNVNHMQGFITEISNNAKKGYLDKAAKGMDRIAKAVNSIDKSKAESFANLFKGAGELTDNKQAFNSLLTAVKEIRDSLAGGSAPITAGPSVQPGGNPMPINTNAQSNTGLTPVLTQLSTTLNAVQIALTQLPAQIQSIKITVLDD
jgi:hypothetical protein